MKEVDALIVHDNSTFSFMIAQELTGDNLEAIIENVAFASSIKEATHLLASGVRPKTVIAHKGIEHGSDISPLIDGIRKTEGGELVRIGLVSGEFFGETVCQTALQLGADFGWDMTESFTNRFPSWVRQIASLGYLRPEELALRGKEIVLSARTAQKRLELLGVTSAPSSQSPEDTVRF
jgi:hypothetical protein